MKDASLHRGGGTGGAADETAASVTSSSHLLLSLLFSLSHTHIKRRDEIAAFLQPINHPPADLCVCACVTIKHLTAVPSTLHL